MCKYCLSEIRQDIRAYNLSQILKTGENDMIDKHIDKQLVEQLLSNQDEPKPEVAAVNLEKTLNDIEKSKLFEDIINLKNKK